MPYNRATAKSLLTSAELVLFDAGRRDAIAKFDQRTLNAKISRTRKLRDKYRDLYRRQRLATRERTGAKRGPGGATNLRTKDKEGLFGELLARFEAQLAKVVMADRRAAERAARGQEAAAKAARVAGKGPASRTRSAKPIAKRSTAAKQR